MVLLISILLLLFSVTSAVANPVVETDSLVTPFKERIGIHTNTTEWLLLTPNIGVEYSFIQNKHNKYSLLIHGKYNPNSSMSFSPELIYNIGGARAEVRKYFRMHQRTEAENGLDSIYREKYGSLGNFWYKLTSRPYSLLGKKNPRKHIAYYIGPYFAFDKYTIKLSRTGYQGHSFGFGAVAGYSVPLYHYKNGSSIDFEMGLGIGLATSKNEMFEYDHEANVYYHTGAQKTHLVPFPVISDARVAFVYRLKSIKDQIVDIKQDKIDELTKIDSLRQKYESDIAEYIYPTYFNKEKQERIKSEYYIPSDSIIAWNNVINRKNTVIQEINKEALQYTDVDSTILLEELHLYYEYVTLPEKLFRRYNYELPNKEISSIAELNNPYLNELINKYAVVNSYERIKGEFEKYLLNAYNENCKDSISGIKFLDVMVSAVNNLNSFVIKLHNDDFHVNEDRETIDAIPVKTVISDGTKQYKSHDFVFGIDTLVLVEQQSLSFKGINEKIETRNDIKLIELTEFLEQKRAEKEALAAEAMAQKLKAKDKKKKKKRKAEKTSDGILSIESESDSLQTETTESEKNLPQEEQTDEIDEQEDKSVNKSELGDIKDTEEQKSPNTGQ